MGVQVTNRFREQCRAGWVADGGQVVTSTHVDGPMSFRFEVTTQQRETFVFRCISDVAMALYLSGGKVSGRMSSERAVELICAGAARGGYREAAEHARNTVQDRRVRHHVYGERRYQAANDVAGRIVCLTRQGDRYLRFPQWHPAWRVNELDAPAGVLAGVA